MVRRLLSLAVLLMFALVMASAQGQDKDKEKDKDKGKEKGKEGEAGKVTLAWKFEKGKKFYQTMTTSTEQSMKVMNHDVKQNQKQTFYFSWTPVEQKGDSWIIEQKIEGVKMDIDIGNQKISYDSTAKENKANNPLSDFIQALVGQTFKLTLDTKTMAVTSIEGRDAFLEKLTKANPQMKPLLDQILSEKALMQMAEPTFSAIPNKEIGEDNKTWSKKSTLDMGPIGTYENNYTYTYEGKEGDLAKIGVKTTLTYKAPGETAGAASLPFKIKSADLTTTSAAGTILFNPAEGRIAKSDMDLKLEGELSIEIGGQTTKVSLVQTQKSAVETSDKDPLAKE